MGRDQIRITAASGLGVWLSLCTNATPLGLPQPHYKGNLARFGALPKFHTIQ